MKTTTWDNIEEGCTVEALSLTEVSEVSGAGLLSNAIKKVREHFKKYNGRPRV